MCIKLWNLKSSLIKSNTTNEQIHVDVSGSKLHSVLYPIEKFPRYYESDSNDVTWQRLKLLSTEVQCIGKVESEKNAEDIHNIGNSWWYVYIFSVNTTGSVLYDPCKVTKLQLASTYFDRFHWCERELYIKIKNLW